MIELALFIHYLTIALAIGLNSIGVGIGEGITGVAALKAIDRQPHAHNDILRIAFMGTALIETTAIVGMFVAIMLLLNPPAVSDALTYPYLAELGIAFAVCLSGTVIGVVSSFPAREACNAAARQPFFTPRIVGFTIMTQALIQTPIIVGFIVALLIKSQAPQATCMADALRLIASGLCVGLGGVGPALGLAQFAKSAVRGIGINRKAYQHLLSFTLVSQAIIETPVIFALVVSLMMLFLVPSLHDGQMLRGIALIAAALATGIGTMGPGISSGNTAAAAATQIAYNPQLHGILSRASMLAQALIETCVIYSVLLSFVLIFLL